MSQPLRILIVEDSEDDVLLLRRALRRGGYEVASEVVQTAEAMRFALENQDWDVITSDHAMPRFSAPAALALAKKLRPDVPFIIVSGEINLHLAISLMKAGANDYIQKDELARLAPAIEHELQSVALRRKQHETETALIQSEERLREVLENSQSVAYKRNLLTDTYDYLSPAFTQITGYTPQEMNAMPFESALQLIHPDDLPEIRRVMAEIRSSNHKSTYQMNYRFKHKQGPYRWVQDCFTVLEDSGGAVVARIGNASDITEHKQAEQALRETHWRIESIIEGARVGTWEWNVQSGETSFNEVWARIAGYILAELAPVSIQTWLALAHPDDRQASNDLLQRHFSGELPYYDYECRMKHKDGHWIWVHDRGRVITRTADGQPLLMFGTRTDITRRKLSEMGIYQLNAELEQRVLERTRQIEAINKELESFNYSVSHDLRAPLRRIKVLTQALRDDNNLQTPESLEMIERIVVSVERMNALVEALLKLARFSRSEIKRQAVDLSAMVHRIIAESQQSQAARPVEFVIAEGVTVNGDAQLLQIVLENLLDNALKFTTKNASARIEFGLAPQADGNMAYFIRDNGAGFNMEHAHRLFGTFQRLHNESEFPGIGIGLVTVQRIIHRHGGRVWAEGVEGVGAVFYFTVG